MKYEKDFQAFYNKYSRLYNSDRNYYQATVYNHPYYQYIVQPQDKYREPFIHASKFNNDRLTEKIGYEKLEPFPYRDFRMSTPLYRSQMDLTSQRRENTYQKDPQQLQQQQEQDHYARNQYSEAELKYYNDFIKQKEYEEMEKGKMHQPQHVVDYAVTPGNECQKEKNVNPFFSNNQLIYSNVSYELFFIVLGQFSNQKLKSNSIEKPKQAYTFNQSMYILII